MTGQLKPGSRIIEQQWSSALGIGQPTLREGLKELEFQGLVRKTPNRGTYVTELKAEDYRKLLEVRLPLEVQAFERAALRIDKTAATELTALVNRLRTSAAQSDMAAFHEADVAFHRRVWDLAGNEYLRMCLETVSLRLFVFSVLGRGAKLAVESHAAVKQHEGMLAGILSGNTTKARNAFLSHTLQYWNTHYDLHLELESVSVLTSVPRPLEKHTEERPKATKVVKRTTQTARERRKAGRG